MFGQIEAFEICLFIHKTILCVSILYLLSLAQGGGEVAYVRFEDVGAGKYPDHLTKFSAGTKFKFRIFTQNRFGKSDFAKEEPFYVTPDAKPTTLLGNVRVEPAEGGSSKVLVSWDAYPREDYNSYGRPGCCIHVHVEARDADRRWREQDSGCVDPRKSGTFAGWDDSAPFTSHRVTTWFSNKAGRTAETVAVGYNHQLPPSKPQLAEEQPQPEPRRVTVRYQAMPDDDIKGNFTAYEVFKNSGIS